MGLGCAFRVRVEYRGGDMGWCQSQTYSTQPRMKDLTRNGIMTTTRFRCALVKSACTRARSCTTATAADCDNQQMLESWGVYLEDNTNRMTAAERGSCTEHLRSVTLATLESAVVLERSWTAPRCRTEVVALRHGPLRCSLARLAYEVCVSAWAISGAEAQTASLFEASPPRGGQHLDATTRTRLADRRYRHARRGGTL